MAADGKQEAEPVTPEIMLVFYRRLYPFKSIYSWLNHEHVPTRMSTHREFAFTLQGDVYLRYNSFSNADELKKQVCGYNPTRFEIGPVYSARVSLSSHPFLLIHLGPLRAKADAFSHGTGRPSAPPRSRRSSASSCSTST